MGKDPGDIRAEIAETRARVGDQVDALSYKTDVPARMGDYVEERKQAVRSTVSGARDAVVGTVSGAKDRVVGTASKAVPSAERAGRLRESAERNPIGLAVGAAALGFVAGMLIPSTRVENERMGEMSDRAIEAAKATAGDALERGKQVVSEAAQTAKESGQEQAHELASSLQDRAQELTT